MDCANPMCVSYGVLAENLVGKRSRPRYRPAHALKINIALRRSVAAEGKALRENVPREAHTGNRHQARARSRSGDLRPT